MNRHASILCRRDEVGTLYFVALLRQELGKRIQSARAEAGLTQRELADLVGIRNASDISRYERGLIEVRSHRIDRIAEATGKPRSYFTRDADEPDPASLGDEQLRRIVREELSDVTALLGRLLERLGDDVDGEQPLRTRRGASRRRSGTA